jgi:putative Mn2+ efflux pump MntP
METGELIITAIALSMDAFAVALCKGLATEKVSYKHALISGAWFGGFQGLMPLIGYFLASLFASFIEPVSAYVAFVLLAIIGFNMIKESFGKEDDQSSSFAVGVMLPLAVATSIDALTVGVGFAMIKDLDIWVAVSSIGIITFILSSLGVKLGSHLGSKIGKTAERIGGIILILMGGKILLEYLFT